MFIEIKNKKRIKRENKQFENEKFCMLIAKKQCGRACNEWHLKCVSLIINVIS